jgi:hypothetical protein
VSNDSPSQPNRNLRRLKTKPQDGLTGGSSTCLGLPSPRRLPCPAQAVPPRNPPPIVDEASMESSQSFIKALQVWCISLLPAFPPPPAQISPKGTHKHRKKGMIFIPASSRREQQPGSWRVSRRRGGAGNHVCRSLGGAGNRATRTCEAGPGAGNPSAWHKMEDLMSRRCSSLMPSEKPGIAVALFWLGK